MSDFGGGDGARGEGRERGARRTKLAGYLKAANNIRQKYTHSYPGAQHGDIDDDTQGIPEFFPDVGVISHGDEQLIVFPQYAKRHTNEPPNEDGADGPFDVDYWERGWKKFKDDKAVVDVDVRGWVYSPHQGPMTRKNRLLIGVARRLCGISGPKAPSGDNSPDGSLRGRREGDEEKGDQEKISQKAEEILKSVDGEVDVAARGGFSDKLEDDSEGTLTSDEQLGPGPLSVRASSNELSPAELLAANERLMARVKLFLTNPLVSTSISLFFYDEKTSVTHTVRTNEFGQFTKRASLDFVPTHVRVLASENLSATEEVKITELKGVSVISDVDDTIKKTSVGSGAREIFRNTFIRDLAGLTIDGVREWYNTMYDMGVGIHYVSNSPWQLFPVLKSFFQMAGLPPGSYHLKHYNGMLHGIFEPVAERKKGTLEQIMRDFPERRFILIGDSGEADLEVYTDVVLANPGKVIAIFIRDVTTPPECYGIFDPSLGPLSGDRQTGRNAPSGAESGDSRMSKLSISSGPGETVPSLLPGFLSEYNPQTSDSPKMGNLIDFDDDETEQLSNLESHPTVLTRSVSESEPMNVQAGKLIDFDDEPDEQIGILESETTGLTRSASDRAVSRRRSARLKVSAAYKALRSSSRHRQSLDTASIGSTGSSEDESNRVRIATNAPVNKKVELWKTRWQQAKDILVSQDVLVPVMLRCWRKGGDVALEAVRMVERAMTQMGVEGYGKGKEKGKTGDSGGEVKVKDLKR